VRFLIKTGLIALAAFVAAFPGYAQTSSVYDLKLLKAQVVDTVDGKDVVAFFSVTAAQKKDFPPVLSMGITCKVNDETPQRIDIMRAGGRVALVVYGPSIAERNPEAYELIKDQLDKLSTKDYQILAFYFRNITQQPLQELTLIYGLWEKRNQQRRIEQEFQYSFK